MRWLAGLYVASLGAIGICSVGSSLRRRPGLWPTALEAATSVAWPLLVAAYFWAPIATWLGWSVLPIFALALVWTGYTLQRDFRPAALQAYLPTEQGMRGYWQALAVCALIVVPVVVLGSLVAWRALGRA